MVGAGGCGSSKGGTMLAASLAALMMFGPCFAHHDLSASAHLAVCSNPSGGMMMTPAVVGAGILLIGKPVSSVMVVMCYGLMVTVPFWWTV